MSQIVDSLVRAVAASIGAVLFYCAWLALVLSVVPRSAFPLPLAPVLTAAVTTAAGFWLGTLLGDRLTRRPLTGKLQACLWPLAGCLVGALVVYPFGAMLTVFGMFGVGATAVVAHEVLEWARARYE